MWILEWTGEERIWSILLYLVRENPQWISSETSAVYVLKFKFQWDAILIKNAMVWKKIPVFRSFHFFFRGKASAKFSIFKLKLKPCNYNTLYWIENWKTLRTLSNFRWFLWLNRLGRVVCTSACKNHFMNTLGKLKSRLWSNRYLHDIWHLPYHY